MNLAVQCPDCGAHYRVELSRLSASGTTVACRGCGHHWTVHRPATAALPDSPAVEAICPDCGHAFSQVPLRGQGSDRPRILVVEDQDYFVQLAREALGDGFRMVSVRTPSAALREIARTPPDLLVLDLMLSEGGDGRDVLRSLPARAFPILIFTSKDEQEMYGLAWDELRALGADDLLIKGINVSDELQRKVEALLAGGSRAESAAVPPRA